MGYAIHVEKFPGSIDSLCGRKGKLVLRDPAKHRITCSICVKALKRLADENQERLLMENFELNPDPHPESLPPPVRVRYDYVFTFRPYAGEYAYRGTSERWAVYQNEELIGRITRKADDEYVAYRTLDRSIGGSSRHESVLAACMELSTLPVPKLMDTRGELRAMLAELQ